MELTPLELGLGGGLLSLVVALATHFFTRSNYVSCRACDERHKLVEEKFKAGEARDSKLFTMVKALVVYTAAIPDDEKAKLLSERRE